MALDDRPATGWVRPAAMRMGAARIQHAPGALVGCPAGKACRRWFRSRARRCSCRGRPSIMGSAPAPGCRHVAGSGSQIRAVSAASGKCGDRAVFGRHRDPAVGFRQHRRACRRSRSRSTARSRPAVPIGKGIESRRGRRAAALPAPASKLVALRLIRSGEIAGRDFRCRCRSGTPPPGGRGARRSRLWLESEPLCTRQRSRPVENGMGMGWW